MLEWKSFTYLFKVISQVSSFNPPFFREGRKRDANHCKVCKICQKEKVLLLFLLGLVLFQDPWCSETQTWIFAMLFYQKLSCFPWLHKTSVLDLSNKWSIPQSILQKQTAVFLLAKKSRLEGSRPQPANLHKLLGRTKFSRKFINRSNFHSIESPAKYIPRSQLKAIWGKLWAPKMAEFRLLFWSSRGVWMQLVLEQFSAIVNNVQHLSRHVGPKNTQRPETRNTGLYLTLVGWKEAFASCVFFL